MDINNTNIDTFDPTWLDAQLTTIGHSADKAIPLLQSIQKKYNYLPKSALIYICEHSDITPSNIIGVSTFYPNFRHAPSGRHRINVCVGTACHIKGAGLVYDGFRRNLSLGDDTDTDTDPQGLFTLGKVACLGCCALAPAVQIDDIIYGHVTAAIVPDIIEDFLKRQHESPDSQKSSTNKTYPTTNEIRLCLDSCCAAAGSGMIERAAKKTISRYKLPARIKRVGCVGMCHKTPLIEIVANGASHYYANLRSDDVSSIILNHFRPQTIINKAKCWIDTKSEALLLSEPTSLTANRRRINTREKSIRNFFEKQKHVATEHYGMANPLDIDEYIDNGGFSALKKCLGGIEPGDIINTIEEFNLRGGTSPSSIINTIKRSNLRGRGGAGFPTGAKWEAVRDSASSNSSGNSGGDVYVICNGDEGDPGAFMDRMLFESFPYRVIEGMIIAAYAVGANKGIFYIRAEYPASIKTLQAAIDVCEDNNLLGDNIIGSVFSLKLTIVEGAGAFVCGEETALIASIEGKRGMPSQKPPYPSSCGLFGRPTLINNCETFACVPWIIRNGAERFREMGTEQSSGTKVFALAGKTARGGLIEVPLGITIREIVEHIGGGVYGGHTFKAVQIGGPSGGCIPKECCDIPVDYESLADIGAMMGSGGLVVLDERDCMVDIAKYFLTFTQNQSCGRCTFCRVGTRRMLDILEKICDGLGTARDLSILEDLAESTKRASLCGLGRSAPNPVLTTLKYFRDEYEAHINGICPAGRCKGMISYDVTDRCIGGCTVCSQNCPAGAIPFTPYNRPTIDDDLCTRCGTCREACPSEAISIIPKREGADL